MTHASPEAGHPPAIRVGLIGASMDRGWAAMAHVPALGAVPGLVLHAVATRNEKSARAAADAFGAPLWFADAGAMIAHEEVDAVVVAVRATGHFALVKQALLAGKPVYCEWPFTRSIEEARELDDLARERGAVTAVGLQGRFSPWVRQVRDVVASGRLGRILSTSLTAFDELTLGSINQSNAYLLDVRNGANPLTIHSGHYIDALCFALGELATVSAVMATSRPRILVRQTGETITATSPDQITVCGLLENGAAASFHMRAGSGDPSCVWDIQGEDALLRVSSPGYLIWRPLKLEIRDSKTKQWETVSPPVPVQEWDGVGTLEGPAQYVAYVYAAFAEDIRTGSRKSVSFSDARKRRETIEAISTAARDGTAQSPLTGPAV